MLRSECKEQAAYNNRLQSCEDVKLARFVRGDNQPGEARDYRETR